MYAYYNWAIVSVLQMDLMQHAKEFFSNLSIDHWSTIIFEDIADHSKYADQITGRFAKDEKFANEQWAHLEYLLNAPVSSGMLNETSIGNLAYLAQVHGENSQWMKLYDKIVSELRRESILSFEKVFRRQ